MSANFLQSLRKETFCRIAPSPIHGVGVFAIIDIPKGINPMGEARDFDFHEVPVFEIQGDHTIPEAVKKLVKDMCPEERGKYLVPPFSLNEIGISYYLNHSKTPNMVEEDGDFVTARDIKAGEELTVDYGTYGELNLE
jgi:uncharacterized protein